MTAPTPPVETVPAETAPPAAPPAPAPVPTPPPAQPAPEAAPPAEGEQESADIAKVRREAASYRTKLREQETAAQTAQAQAAEHATKLTEMQAVLDAITKAVTGNTDEAPDPAKLVEQLAAEKAQRESDVAALTAEHAAKIRDLTVRAALPGVFAKAGADPDLTHAVLLRDGALSTLDPSSDTFTTDLASAVSAAVEANPKLKVAPVAVRSGAEIPGRSGGSDQLTLEQVRGMKPAEIEKARVAGRLKGLGIGPG